jgi:uncharacterized membrane protein YoaK (UPF0700 family)
MIAGGLPETMEDDGRPWDMQRAPSLSNSCLLAAIGGFLDSFTYLGHGHVFANAMTGNVVLLGIYGVAKDWHQSLRHLPPILTFVLGVSAAKAALLPRAARAIRHPYLFVLAWEVVILLCVSVLPQSTNDWWITTSIAFAASLQVETFRVVNGRSFNSTFTTGNLRTLSEGVFEWFFGGNRTDAATKMRDFAGICLSFFLGAILGGVCTSRMGNRALWIDVLLLMFVMARLRPGTKLAFK